MLSRPSGSFSRVTSPAWRPRCNGKPASSPALPQRRAASIACRALVAHVVYHLEPCVGDAGGQTLPGLHRQEAVVAVVDDEGVGGHPRQQSGDIPSINALARKRGTQGFWFDTLPDIGGKPGG